LGTLRLIVTVVALAVMTIVLMPLQTIATRRSWPLAARLPWYWQRVARRLIGIRVNVVGEPAKPPLLITANHVSWLDITILGSVLPVSFIAKQEVASWPVIGLLARLQRTVFVDRTRRTDTGRATEAVAGRIGKGDVMVLFAEGTTGDGTRILPFRSALIGAASAAAGAGPIAVQPVALVYTRIQGIPVGRTDLPGLAWYGDTSFGTHFYRLLTKGGIDAVVAFGEPMVLGPETDRKRIAERCFAAVKRMAEEVRRGEVSSTGRPGHVFSPQAKGAKGAGTAGAAGELAAPGE
jgi:lyso-ornithine lipid O-acyltransferase